MTPAHRRRRHFPDSPIPHVSALGSTDGLQETLVMAKPPNEHVQRDLFSLVGIDLPRHRVPKERTPREAPPAPDKVVPCTNANLGKPPKH